MSIVIFIIPVGCKNRINKNEIKKLYNEAIQKWAQNWQNNEDKGKVENIDVFLDKESQIIGYKSWNDYIQNAKRDMGEEEVERILKELNNTSFNRLSSPNIPIKNKSD